ncbi:MAG: glycosyltransferase family 2 protein [Vicingaceae bacterium]
MYSIVSPVYGCRSCLEELCDRIRKVFDQLEANYEIILVDDKADETTWKTIESIANRDDRIKGIELSRNFGQHYAITCGLNYAKGDWIILLDCDLQDVPEEIPKLIREAEKGFDIVLASRKLRQDSFFKKASSKLFYKLLSFLTDTKQDHTVANFGLYRKNTIDAFLKMKDHVRYFPTMIQWVGFKKTSVEVAHSKRLAGESSYSLKKLISLALNNIISFSDKPLRLTINFGLIISTIAFLIGFYYFILYQLGEIVQLGFTSIILSIWFLAGLTFVNLGVIGLYLGKVFEKVKDRPKYIVKNKVNFD